MVVGVVRVIPIDEQAAPDHHEEDGKVDPVHPAYCERMLVVEDDGRRSWNGGSTAWLSTASRCSRLAGSIFETPPIIFENLVARRTRIIRTRPEHLVTNSQDIFSSWRVGVTNLHRLRQTREHLRLQI